MTEGVLDRYKRRVAAGEFEVDEAQLEAATRFDVLARDLEAWRPPGKGLFSRWRRR